MIRDEELNRLMRYAQGMGLSVRFKPFVKGSARAEWVMDGSEVTVYVTNRSSKLEKILSLIHELGHHKAFVYAERTNDPEVTEAMDSDTKRASRKRVYEMEKHDAQFWDEIYRDTNCQFGLHILHRQREYDVWVYENWYKNGKDPSWQERVQKRKELRKKYG